MGFDPDLHSEQKIGDFTRLTPKEAPPGKKHILQSTFTAPDITVEDFTIKFTATLRTEYDPEIFKKSDHGPVRKQSAQLFLSCKNTDDDPEDVVLKIHELGNQLQRDDIDATKSGILIRLTDEALNAPFKHFASIYQHFKAQDKSEEEKEEEKRYDDRPKDWWKGEKGGSRPAKHKRKKTGGGNRQSSDPETGDDVVSDEPDRSEYWRNLEYRRQKAEAERRGMVEIAKKVATAATHSFHFDQLVTADDRERFETELTRLVPPELTKEREAIGRLSRAYYPVDTDDNARTVLKAAHKYFFQDVQRILCQHILSV